MEDTMIPAGAMSLIGGHLCLDFTNTVGGRRGTDVVQDKLRVYGDIVAWSKHTNILNESKARQLLREATRRPDESQAVLARVIALREALYRIFVAVADDKEPRAADLALFNAELARALAHSRIVSSHRGFEWDWDYERTALDQMLGPVVRSAAELLTSGDLARVSQCASETCGWLFVDSTKNHSRRWCDMSDCGNRAKARRHYRRLRAMAQPN